MHPYRPQHNERFQSCKGGIYLMMAGRYVLMAKSECPLQGREDVQVISVGSMVGHRVGKDCRVQHPR